VVNLPLSVFASLFGGLSVFVLVFISFGYFTSLAIKEAGRKNEYLFYYNAGISRQWLWLSAYFISVGFAVVAAAIYILIEKW
jgi:hypothetical protein